PPPGPLFGGGRHRPLPPPFVPRFPPPFCSPLPGRFPPPVVRPLLTPARSARALRPWPSKPHGAQSTPGRSPRVRTAAFPLRPSRLRDDLVGDAELRRNRPAGPSRHASRAAPPPGDATCTSVQVCNPVESEQ